MIRTSSFINICLCLSSLKLLFLKSYVSTDFDVHRNWMAITYNLPIKDWYYDTTSEWTLDYPPLFAAFEFLLALVAHLLNLDDVLALTEASIRTESIVIYQKVSVIISDFVYYYAVYRLCSILNRNEIGISSNLKKKNNNDQGEEKGGPILAQNLVESIFRPDTTSCIAWLLLLQPGLLLVDHVHFQYNGFLSGVFLLSMANIMDEKFAAGAFWFSILINLKHIYLYCAPAFGMYTLTKYCSTKENNQYRVVSFIKRAIKLALVVALVFVITYLPYAERDNLEQIASRLFPFKRGLTHAYWAPNVWSLYNTADKLLATVFKNSLKVKFDLDSISGYRRKALSSTSGLVQEYEHQYLPSIEPLTTLILVVIFTLPLVVKFLFKLNKSSSSLFAQAVTVATFTSFMFGWHVHEKAIILVLLPMTLIIFTDNNIKTIFLRLTLAGTYSLFPLLYQPAEYPIKLTVLIAYYFYARSMLKSDQNSGKPTSCEPANVSTKIWFGPLRFVGQRLYNLLDNSFVVSIILVEAYITLIHGRLDYDWNPLAKLNKYEFLPLMLTSSLSALGITFSYLELYYHFVAR